MISTIRAGWWGAWSPKVTRESRSPVDSSPSRSADRFLLAGAAWLLFASRAFPATQVLDPGLHHLRAGAAREWAEFPETPEGPDLAVRFPAARNPGEVTLRLRQEDVKLAWRVVLNGAELGRLVTDENALVLQLVVPAGRLVDGENLLRIEPVDRKTPDDIRAGE